MLNSDCILSQLQTHLLTLGFAGLMAIFSVCLYLFCFLFNIHINRICPFVIFIFLTPSSPCGYSKRCIKCLLNGSLQITAQLAMIYGKCFED